MSLRIVEPPLPSPDEQRKARRRQVMVGARVLPLIPRSSVVLGQLVDVSASGAQLNLVGPFEPGARIRVFFHVTEGLTSGLDAVVRWHAPIPGGYRHGIEFIGLNAEQDRGVRALADCREPSEASGNRSEGGPDQPDALDAESRNS